MTTATLDRPSTATTAATILQRAVCLTLRCHYLGNDRHVDLADIALTKAGAALDVDKEQTSLTKKLVNPKTLRPAMRVLGQAKAYLRSVAIPTHRVFGERSYLIPLAAVRNVDATLAGFAGDLEVVVAPIADDWARTVAEQAATLGQLFDAAQYPTAADVRRAFGIEWDWVSFAAPEKLETVDRALFESARDRYATRMAEAYDEVRVVLRESLRKVTEEIVDKLTPDADGKPKNFRGTVLRDLGAFLGSFDMRNIADDDELAAVVADLRRLTDGVTPDDLKTVDALREDVRTRIAAATAQLGQLVEKGRGRAISFGGGIG